MSQQRKIMRNMAHKNMEKQGLKHVNRKRRTQDNDKRDSYFALNWRDWVTL